MVASATTFRTLLKMLGQTEKGHNAYSALRERIAAMGLSTAHFTHVRRFGTTVGGTKKLRDISDEEFAQILAQVDRFSTFLKALGLSGDSSHLRHMIKDRAKRLGLSMDHFAFRRLDSESRVVTLENHAIFRANSVWAKQSGGKIVRKLIDEGLRKECCERCGNGPKWQGEPLPLLLWRMNNKKSDLRLENIKVVCANCWYQVNKEAFLERSKIASHERSRKMKFQKYQRLLAE